MIFLEFGLLVISSLSSTSNAISDQSSEPEGVVDEPRRTKRITWGEPLMDMNAYDVTHYLVHITGGTCASTRFGFYFWHLGICEPPAVEDTICGGALIKEYVVQTACHCIAFFTAINDTHMKVTPRVVWEHTFAMYVGYFDITKMKEGSRPTLFLQHQKCKRFVMAGLSYDFGIIVTQVPLIKQHLSVREAPVYSVSELYKLYQEVQQEQRVCLLAGWGVYRIISIGNEGEYESKVPQFLQHSWVRAMNYRECYMWQFQFRVFLWKDGKKFNLTYKDLANWFCGRHFGKFRGVTGSGDSGAPVTCDNEYLGIVSSSAAYEGFKRPEFKSIFTSQAAIRFTEHSNAAEFRRSFLTEVHTLLFHHLLGLKKKGRDRDFGDISMTYMDSGSRPYLPVCHLQLILNYNFLFFLLSWVGCC